MSDVLGEAFGLLNTAYTSIDAEKNTLKKDVENVINAIHNIDKLILGQVKLNEDGSIDIPEIWKDPAILHEKLRDYNKGIGYCIATLLEMRYEIQNPASSQLDGKEGGNQQPNKIEITVPTSKPTSVPTVKKGFFPSWYSFRERKLEIDYLNDLHKATSTPTITETETVKKTPLDYALELIPDMNKVRKWFADTILGNQNFTDFTKMVLDHEDLKTYLQMISGVIESLCYVYLLRRRKQLDESRERITSRVATMIQNQPVMYPPMGSSGPQAKQDGLSIKMMVQQAVEREMRRQKR